MTPTTRAVTRNIVTFEDHDGSDYGSDVDEATLHDLLSQAESQPLSKTLVLESIEEYAPVPRAVHVPNAQLSSPSDRPRRVLIDENGVPFEVLAREGPLRQPSVEVEYDSVNRVAFSRKQSCIS